MYIVELDGSGKNFFVRLLKSKTHLVAQVSAGIVGLKGPKKWTTYAAGVVCKAIIKRAVMENIKFVDVRVWGLFSKEVRAALEVLADSRLKVNKVIMRVAVAHNGVRFRKGRRK